MHQKFPPPTFPPTTFHFFFTIHFPGSLESSLQLSAKPLKMSALRKIMESPPKNTGKRPAEPNPEQWYTSNFREPEQRTQQNAKKRRVVPEQLNFTERDSVQSMRAQIEGLRAENEKLRIVNEKQARRLVKKDQDVNIALCNHAALQNQMERQERRHMDDNLSHRENELQLLANCRAYEREKVAMQDAFDAKWKEKESEVRRLQREFNDAVNALLASEVE